MIDLRLLGAIDVRASHRDWGGPVLTQPKRVALLVYLALAEPRGLHSRDRLLALFWPEADDNSSRHSLRNALHAIRQALGDDVVVTRGEAWVGLDFHGLRCDALELRAHLAAGRVSDALALWTGDLAPGFHVSGAPEFEHWLDEERAALGGAVRAAAWKQANALEGSGAAEMEAVRQAVRLDPGNEPGARRLMRLLAAMGDRSGALRAYQELAAWFARELEAAPSAETEDLAEQLRATGPVRQAPRDRVVDVVTHAPRAGPSMPITVAPPVRRIRRGAIALALVSAVALGGAAYLERGIPARVERGTPANASDPAAEAQRAVLRLPVRYRADTAAYSSYLRGLTLRFQFRFAASRDTMAALVNRDPLYVPGLYGLAHAWIFLALNNSTDPDEAWPRIDELARRALALDSTAANAWLVLASEDMFEYLDLPRAGAQLDRARSLDLLDPDVAGMRSVWFRFQGEMDSAVAEAQVAHRLDPLSLYFGRLVAKQLYFARRYDESRRVYMQLLQDNPEWLRADLDLAQLNAATGRPREAVAWLRRARAAQGDSAGAAALGAAVTDAEAVRLLMADARRSIARLDRAARAGEQAPASGYASAFAVLKDTVATLAWLDSIVVQRDSYLHQVRLDPVFDFVRGKPEYRSWEKRSGLPAMPAAAREGRSSRSETRSSSPGTLEATRARARVP
ncbi:MAG: BTAD domain-containing putative transcriptional regulator [Gemmatimonadaceae bacterium]